jgi:hypothetical protein
MVPQGLNARNDYAINKLFKSAETAETDLGQEFRRQLQQVISSFPTNKQKHIMLMFMGSYVILRNNCFYLNLNESKNFFILLSKPLALGVTTST